MTKTSLWPSPPTNNSCAVDVATDFRQRNNKSIETVPKHTIPLLEEVLRLVMTQHKTRVSIQPKMDCVADAIALVTKMGAEKWVGFNDGNLQYMSRGQAIGPGHTGVLGPW